MDLYRDNFMKKDLEISPERAVSHNRTYSRGKSARSKKSKYTVKSHLTGKHSVEDV